MKRKWRKLELKNSKELYKTYHAIGIGSHTAKQIQSKLGIKKLSALTNRLNVLLEKNLITKSSEPEKNNIAKDRRIKYYWISKKNILELKKVFDSWSTDTKIETFFDLFISNSRVKI